MEHVAQNQKMYVLTVTIQVISMTDNVVPNQRIIVQTVTTHQVSMMECVEVSQKRKHEQVNTL